MSAALALMGKDWRELLRDRRGPMLLLITLIFAALALFTAAQRIASYEGERRTTDAREQRTWQSQGARNPHSAAHFSRWALRPLAAEALLDPGITPYAGAAIWMEAHNQNPARARPAEDNVQLSSLGELSVAWLLQLLLPLLVVVLAAGAIARERERGTLKLIVASGVTPGQLLWRKFLSVSSMWLLVALPLWLAAYVAGTWVGSINPLRFALWLLAYAGFLTMFALTAVAVSAHARGSAQAMLLLVGLWLFAVVIVPRAGSAAAELIAPTPPTDQLWTEMKQALDEGPKVFGADAKAFGEAMAQRYGVARVEDLPVNFAGLQLEADERHGNAVFDRFHADLAIRYGEQRSALRWGNMASPVPALQNISMALAGTDLAHQLAFVEQAETHRRQLITQLNTDMIEHAGAASWDYRAPETLWQKTVEFAFQPPSLRQTLRSIAPDALILLAWVLASALLLRRASRTLGTSIARGGN